VTRLNLDLLEGARAQFLEEPGLQGQEPVVLAEMTLNSLTQTSAADVDHADFLARADTLGTLGLDVLISRFRAFYQVADYLTTYTDRMVGIAVGLPGMREIGSEKYYDDVPGGLIESTGRLFKRTVKMYVHPTRDPESGRILTVERAPVPAPWHYLRDLLVETRRLESIRSYDEAVLTLSADDALGRLERGDPAWEAMVPPAVASLIKAKRLFGYRAPLAP
jgi:hypothetical protein